MIKPIQKIVIVGGGSAGWMSAAMLVKAFPDKDITLIESPSVPTVGVGESTIAQINDYIQFLEIDEKDFLKFTDAGLKLSIKFTDFYEKDAGSFHYPFGSPVLDDTYDGLADWFYKKAQHPDIPVQDFARSYWSTMALIEKNKFSLNTNNHFDNYDPTYNYAYHFDASKFALWLKDRYAIPRGCKYISAEVEKINTDVTGVQSLFLSTGQTVTADLFVDCTGFKSILLGDALAEKFISYSDMLPNNKAWATRLPYKNKEKELEPFTNCTALGNGWVWNIPLWSRIGTGYVFSDRYTSEEQALEEFKQHLCSNKMICQRTANEIEELQFKLITMRVGIHQRTWVKNVVAIGLSAGFIEPLESNGLFSVHEFLFKLVKSLQRPAVTQWDVDVYNASCLNLFRNFAEFVALHYALSVRNDTEYWKANNKRTYSPGLDQLKYDPYQGFQDLQHRKMFSYQLPTNAGITLISTGMNYPILDSFTANSLLKRKRINLEKFYETLEKKKQYWNKCAELEPTLYEYLKKLYE